MKGSYTSGLSTIHPVQEKHHASRPIQASNQAYETELPQIALKQDYGISAPMPSEVYHQIYEMIKSAYERHRKSSPMNLQTVHGQQYNAPNHEHAQQYGSQAAVPIPIVPNHEYGQHYNAPNQGYSQQYAAPASIPINNAYNQRRSIPNAAYSQPLKFVAPVSYFTPTDPYSQLKHIQNQQIYQ